MLDRLISADITECVFEKSNDVLVEVVKVWAKENAQGDARFVFDDKK